MSTIQPPVMPSLRGSCFALALVLATLILTVGGSYVLHGHAGHRAGLGLAAVTIEALLLITLLARVIRHVDHQHKALIAQREQLEAALHHAQRMETLGLLAGGVAHDINNVLTAIGCSASVLFTDLEASSPLRIEVEEIMKSATWAQLLTRQLLDLGRKQPLAPRVLDLNAVVSNIEHLLCRLLGAEVRLVTTLSQEACCIYADVRQIQQMIMNLAINAKHAMPEGGDLVIETHVQAPADATSHSSAIPRGERVVLTVTDTGCGMEAAVAAHVFEPFFTTKEPGKGTGLGLSTVYGMVKRFGGEIRLSSERGRGTSFTISLPRHREARA